MDTGLPTGGCGEPSWKPQVCHPRTLPGQTILTSRLHDSPSPLTLSLWEADGHRAADGRLWRTLVEASGMPPRGIK